MKKNIVYFQPTSILGDLLWNSSDYWLGIGYARRISNLKNNFIDFKVGVIVYSTPTSISWLNDINSRSTYGFNLNFEHRINLIKKLYYSTNLFYQNTKTIRDGEYDGITKVSNNSYCVFRSVYCLYPKIGFQFITPKNHTYIDVGFGVGIRYIKSYSVNKINTNINSGHEAILGKEFDKGDKIAHKFYFQIKIGYNF